MIVDSVPLERPNGLIAHGGDWAEAEARFGKPRDGWIDLYVANDQSANQMWMNRRWGRDGGRFVDESLLGGAVAPLLAALSALASATSYALYQIISRKLAAHDPPETSMPAPILP